MAYLATPDPRAPEDQEEGPDLLVLKESRVLPVCLEEMDSQVLRGHRVHRVSEAQWGQLVSRGQGDCRDQWGPRGQKDHRDKQGSPSRLQYFRCSTLSTLCLCRMRQQL